MSLCTPTCSICLKNYNKDVQPINLHPCGHGICTICLQTLQLRDELAKCPLCREIIEGSSPNWDLRTMCDNIESDPTYWGRRLLEVVNLPGTEIEISDQIRPFCKLICTRIIYSSTFKYIVTEPENWNESEQNCVEKFLKTFSKCINKNNIDIDEAFKWIKALNFEKHLEIYIFQKIANFYEIKLFLDEKKASWIIDALSI